MIHNLTVLSESFTNGYKPEVISIFYLTSVLSALFVIISKNPIVSVLFLIALFLSIASYLFILGINFIGLSYLLVYVGAVSILFLFILMLINVRISELLSDTSNSIPLAFIVTVYFNYAFDQALPNYASASYRRIDLSAIKDIIRVFSIDNYSSLFDRNEYYNLFSDNAKIAFVTSKLWDGNIAETTHITSIGNIMYTSYSIWLIITSVILLLAMVGAIVITIKQKN